MLDLGNLIYLDMHKTGSSLTTDFLIKCTMLRLNFYQPHQIVNRISLPPGEVTFITTIRNPLDLYVSLYRYGCEGKGSIAYSIDQIGRSDLYDQGHLGFNRWLEFVLFQAEPTTLGNGFGWVSRFDVGFMSFRHFTYSVYDPSAILPKVTGKQQFEQVYLKQRVTKFILKNETLSSDLRKLATKFVPQYFDQERVLDYLGKNRRINPSTKVAKDKISFDPDIRAEIIRRESLLLRHYPDVTA